jgi:hypothetical protein
MPALRECPPEGMTAANPYFSYLAGWPSKKDMDRCGHTNTRKGKTPP